MTTRGMKEAEMEQVADLIDQVIRNINNADVHQRVAAQVKELGSGFPVPGADGYER
jgi:glycine hydroxymethyltransferase